MKRVLTLVGGIIGTVFDAIYSLMMLIGITAILDLFGGEPGAFLFAVVGVLELLLGIAALIMNIITITAYSCDHDDYIRKRPSLIAGIVLNALLGLLLFYSMISGFSVLILLVFAASIATLVLVSIDMAKENNRFIEQEMEEEDSSISE